MGYTEEQFDLKEWNEGYPQKANEYLEQKIDFFKMK